MDMAPTTRNAETNLSLFAAKLFVQVILEGLNKIIVPSHIQISGKVSVTPEAGNHNTNAISRDPRRNGELN